LSELVPYLKLLAERGPRIASRELASRFFREPPINAVRRVMEVCETGDAQFTFFIVGTSAKDNPAIIEEMIGRGHEIACHGYEHLRFPLLTPDQMRRDLEQALNLFEKQFSYRLNGFRAPYLEMNDDVYSVLKEQGFSYSSSRMGTDGPNTHPSGIREIPIVVDDWEILIKQNKGLAGLSSEMKNNIADQACYLLHPWRVGQKRHIGALQELISSMRGDIRFPKMEEGANVEDALYLSGDIGEFGLLEIARRIVSGFLK
jgi:peptidoglycan/xylan/chitin deacetylase (PgdA/CDA1 family)